MDTKITLSNNGISYNLYPDPNCELMGRPISKGHYYERDVTDLLKRELKPDDVFIDIGACYGWFGILAATVCKCVVMIEPRPDNFQRIVKAANELPFDIASKISFENCGLIPLELIYKERYIHAPKTNSNGIIFEDKADTEDYFRINTKTYQALLKAHLDELPTFVKIDIEGMEYDVLSWAKLPPKLITEFSTVMMGEHKALKYARYLLASHTVTDIATGNIFYQGAEIVEEATKRILNLYCKEIEYGQNDM